MPSLDIFRGGVILHVPNITFDSSQVLNPKVVELPR